MEIKEIIFLFFAICLIILSLPYIMMIFDTVVENFVNAFSSMLVAYKEDWQNCIKTFKKRFIKGESQALDWSDTK